MPPAPDAHDDAHDDLLDALFDALPEDFVATRNATVRTLQSDGATDAAAAVKSLKRPTLATWALNRAARNEAEAVRAYLDASRELRRAQEQGSGELRDVIHRHRARQQELVDLVVEQAATQPGDPERVRAPAQETLEAAALDDVIAGALACGRLVSTERAASAFDVLDVQESPRAAASRPKPEARKPLVDERRVALARDAVAHAEEALTGARDALAEAEREVEERRHAVAEAEDATRVAREELAREELARVQRGEDRGRISG